MDCVSRFGGFFAGCDDCRGGAAWPRSIIRGTQPRAFAERVVPPKCPICVAASFACAVAPPGGIPIAGPTSFVTAADTANIDAQPAAREFFSQPTVIRPATVEPAKDYPYHPDSSHAIDPAEQPGHSATVDARTVHFAPDSHDATHRPSADVSNAIDHTAAPEQFAKGGSAIDLAAIHAESDTDQADVADHRETNPAQHHQPAAHDHHAQDHHPETKGYQLATEDYGTATFHNRAETESHYSHGAEDRFAPSTDNGTKTESTLDDAKIHAPLDCQTLCPEFE